jgi:hypothetical protein
MVFIIPNTSLMLGKLMRPVPGEANIVALMAKRTEAEDSRIKREDLIPKKGALENTILWLGYNYRRSKILINTIEEQRLWLKKQLLFSMNLSRISPTNDFLYIFTHLASTGFVDLIDFNEWKFNLSTNVFDGISRERIRRMKTINVNTNLAEANRQIDSIGPLSPKDLPPRIYPRIDLGRSLAIVSKDFIILILESLIVYMVCFIAFVRKRIQ